MNVGTSEWRTSEVEKLALVSGAVKTFQATAILGENITPTGHTDKKRAASRMMRLPFLINSSQRQQQS